MQLVLLTLVMSVQSNRQDMGKELSLYSCNNPLIIQVVEEYIRENAMLGISCIGWKASKV
ncbi:MAG: hypothetical protein EA345_14530 [Halomonas sp.]|nr:MAG: hypothetical protein EA345_14530 [Halomonas sp.]